MPLLIWMFYYAYVWLTLLYLYAGHAAMIYLEFILVVR